MLFKVTAAAITFTLVNGNEDSTGENLIFSCVINNIHKEDQQKFEYEFFGYNTPEIETFETKTGQKDYCSL